jgi:hypothetical protein
MKTIALALGLATGLAAQLFAGETLRLKLEPEQEFILSGRVKVSYLDELNGGAECSLSAMATVRFTANREVASNSLRAEVAAQKQLLLAALAKDEALADADAGRYQQAAQHLVQNAGELDRAYLNAPASVQAQLRNEADHLRAYANQLEQNQYSSGTRKSLQNESWQWRNSKN